MKSLFWMWLISAVMNLVVFFVHGYDFDKLLIAALEGLLAMRNWLDYKENESTGK